MTDSNTTRRDENLPAANVTNPRAGWRQRKRTWEYLSMDQSDELNSPLASKIRFSLDDFQHMLGNAAKGLSVALTLGDDEYIEVWPLPAYVIVLLTSASSCLLSRHGRAPRRAWKDHYFLTRINRQTVLIKVTSGIWGGAERKGEWWRVVVRVPMGRAVL